MSYRHTQKTPSSVIYIGGALMGVIVVGSLFSGRTGTLVLSILLTVVFVIATSAFGRLTVEVDDTSLQASFGWGWPRKSLELSTASTVRIVRNRWWYGFGIRLIPHGSLWNVWGLDAVEFDLATGKVLRIGTDEPEALFAAITRTVPRG
jgi:hypothetical protein